MACGLTYAGADAMGLNINFNVCVSSTFFGDSDVTTSESRTAELDSLCTIGKSNYVRKEDLTGVGMLPRFCEEVKK